MICNIQKMKKFNIRRIKSNNSLLSQKRNYFVNQVILQDISKIINARDMKMYYAGFKNGARTKLHFHEGGQILFVTGGKGMLVLYKIKNKSNKIIRIQPTTKSIIKTGDMVYIPKNTLHWHGAIENNNFSHIAINSFTSKGKESRTIWYDSDYLTQAIRIK